MTEKSDRDIASSVEPLAEGAVVLRQFAEPTGSDLIESISAIAQVSPFRHLMKSNGMPMSLSMTNCGPVGWINTPAGYGYAAIDPLTGRSWPAMPDAFRRLASQAAGAAGFDHFVPAVCIVNRYAIGAGLHMHQDRDDAKDGQPVISVSLGLPVMFRFGAQKKGMKIREVRLEHGDVVVWGGSSRMAYHGVAPLEPGHHPLTGDIRLNLTFRTARIPRLRKHC